MNLVYRRFYTGYDLGLLLSEARRSRDFQVCYIASHGQRRKLLGIGNRVIRLETLARHCRPSRNTGYIFGACDFVTPDTARRFLVETGARFVAGYQKAIPWTESMLVDCLFLSYLMGGTMKWIRTKHGERRPPLRTHEDFEITRSQNPQKVVGLALPRLPPGPRHHVLVLHPRPRARAPAPPRQLVRRLPPRGGPGSSPRPESVAASATRPVAPAPRGTEPAGGPACRAGAVALRARRRGASLGAERRPRCHARGPVSAWEDTEWAR